MNEILGFIVLTSPLFLILLWVPVCVGLAVWIGRKIFKKGKTVTGVVMGVLVFLFVMVAPVADEIAGRIYFNHLCKTEAGVKVYQTIELPAEYWDEDGKPRFYDESNGNLNLPVGFIEWETTTEKYPLHLEKVISVMREKESGKKLNERVLFFYWSGWVVRNFSPHNTGTSCGSDVTAYTEYINKVFRSRSILQ